MSVLKLKSSGSHVTRPSNRRLFRRFFCGLTLRYHKIINYKAAIYGGVIKLCNFSVSKIVSSEFIECSQFGYLGIKDVLYSHLSSFSFGAVNSFVVTATSSYSLWFAS